MILLLFPLLFPELPELFPELPELFPELPELFPELPELFPPLFEVELADGEAIEDVPWISSPVSNSVESKPPVVESLRKQVSVPS